MPVDRFLVQNWKGKSRGELAQGVGFRERDQTAAAAAAAAAVISCNALLFRVPSLFLVLGGRHFNVQSFTPRVCARDPRQPWP